MTRVFLSYVVASALLLTGCADSPTTEPSPAPVAGVWTGRYREITCTGPAGTCSTRFKAGEPEYEFTLTLTQTGDDIHGTFDRHSLASEAHATGDVSGVVAGVTVQLSGRLQWRAELFPGVQGGMNLDAFHAVVDQSKNAMTGSFHLIHKEGEAERFRTECRILSLTRQAL